jgi:hypothetical protein
MTKNVDIFETFAMRTAGRRLHLADAAPCAEFSRLVFVRIQYIGTIPGLQCGI